MKCLACQKLLLAPIESGLRCISCGFLCHTKCQPEVSTICTPEILQTPAPFARRRSSEQEGEEGSGDGGNKKKKDTIKRKLRGAMSDLNLGTYTKSSSQGDQQATEAKQGSGLDEVLQKEMKMLQDRLEKEREILLRMQEIDSSSSEELLALADANQASIQNLALAGFSAPKRKKSDPK